MKNGFLRVALCTPEVVVGDVVKNTQEIIKNYNNNSDSKIVIMPSGVLAGYTLGDLVFEKSILDSIKDAIRVVADATIGNNSMLVFATPLEISGRIYDCGVVIYNGQILGIIPKENISPELARYFVSGVYAPREIYLGEAPVPIGVDMVFKCNQLESFNFMVTVGDDIDSKCLANGENLIINLGEEYYIASKDIDQEIKFSYLSKKADAVIASINPSSSESTTDYVFAGDGYVFSSGELVAQKYAFDDDDKKVLIDLEKGFKERLKDTNNAICAEFDEITFDCDIVETKICDKCLSLLYSKTPFIPEDEDEKINLIEDVLHIQVAALKKRMKAINCEKLVVGISGGLDSTLAFLVCAYACDELDIPRENITAITMPCFGTSDLTYNNACNLIKLIGATFKEINIKEAVSVHFKDIDHDMSNHNVAFENAQARERTQVLMDIANDEGAIVVGTGDLSELALGWATYNGDHMSMYSVNGDVPKTLIREIVTYIANENEGELKTTLINVVDTPVSPELLPPEGGKISQKTEDKVGPYLLHDFYLYYMLKYGFSPKKIYKMAKVLFEKEFDAETILKWEKVFYQRFFASQYKRSCLPDGPKALSIDVSPRGGLKMPSDAKSRIWLDELQTL